MNLKAVFRLLKETFQEWNEDKASRLAAALAYYTVFSIAPLLLIAIAIVGFIFGQEAAQGQITGQLSGLVGSQVAEIIQGLVNSASQGGGGVSILNIVILLFGASGVFVQLQEALNTIWEVQPKPGQGIRQILQTRLVSFSMILVIGFLLLVSLVLSTTLAAVGNFAGGLLPGFGFLWQLLNFVVSFGVITLLFAAMYKILPDATIAWNDVWIGAGITALLFTIGKWLLGLYLGIASVGSAFGAAGSLVALLIWVYYSAQILFFGAEFTQVYAKRYGSRIQPAANAVGMSEVVRADQGRPHQENVEAAAQDSEAQALGGDSEPNGGMLNRWQRRFTEPKDRRQRRQRRRRSF